MDIHDSVIDEIIKKTKEAKAKCVIYINNIDGHKAAEIICDYTERDREFFTEEDMPTLRDIQC